MFKLLAFKTIWVILIGCITLIVGVLSILGAFGITPVEAKQKIEVIVTVVGMVTATVEDITATLDTEQIENLNNTLIQLSDPELIALFKLWLTQQTE